MSQVRRGGKRGAGDLFGCAFTSSNYGMRFLLLICLSAAVGLGQEITNPVPQGKWVVDDAELLSASEESRLNRLLNRIYNGTKAQIVVVTTARVKERGAVRTYAVRLFRDWKLGSAEANDGVLVFLAAQDRTVEIVTGSGLTGRLPNDRLELLIRERMAPLLRRGETSAALLEASKEMGAMLAGIDRQRKVPTTGLFSLAAIFAAMGLAGAGYAFVFWKQPMVLPPAGTFEVKNELPEHPLSTSWFVDNKPRKLFLRLGYIVKPGKAPEFPVRALWVGAIGLSAAAGLLAGGILSALRVEMEPSLWLVAVITGLTAVAAPVAIYGPSQRDFDGLLKMAGWVAVLTGIVAVLAVNRVLFSDYSISVFCAPLFLFAVGMTASYFLIDQTPFWYPERFTCSQCGKAVVEAELNTVLEDWQQRAMEERLVHYRGWRCTGDCKGPFIAHMVRRKEDICSKCHKPTKLITEENGWRLATCFLCGHQTRQKLPKKTAAAAQGIAASYAATSSSYEPSSSSSSSDSGYDQRQYESSSYDPPASGGTTEGGGAGGNW
jgi:uncharacterized protein